MIKRILTQHPDPQKAGVNIDMGKYKIIKAAILEVIEAAQEVTFSDLISAVRTLVGDTFAGSVSWYVTTVKLDLEGRGLIERVPRKNPQHMRIAE